MKSIPDEFVVIAERQVAALLAQLERDTGSIVRSIEVVDTEITTLDDAHRQVRRHVSIVMERLPGTQWAHQ